MIISKDFKEFIELLNKKFDGIIVNSTSIKEFLIKKQSVPATKIKVIENGIETGDSSNENPEIFAEKSADIWIGLIANLKPVKRIDVFLKALAILKETLEALNCHALIIGEGDERKNLEKLGRELGISDYIHFTGAVDNVHSFVRHMDLGVLSSEREGLSNALMECMAHGVPVIASTAGGNVELVQHNVNGFLFEKNNAEDLAFFIRKLLRDTELRKKMGKNALESIQSNFSWDKTIKETEAYYRSFLNGNSERNI